MASRAKRINSWQEPLAMVAKAKRFTERFEVHHTHPDNYSGQPQEADAEAWDDLLKQMDGGW